MKELQQYLFVCVDSDKGTFDTHVKAESKAHATAIIKDRITCEVDSPNTAALDGKPTQYKSILKGARRVRWTMPSLA